MFTLCPKCGHSPLPADQALPAACPACGVILAKVALAQKVALDDVDEALAPDLS
jgi:predicted  nucleic acid-binding Zn-ribbon protein